MKLKLLTIAMIISVLMVLLPVSVQAQGQEEKIKERSLQYISETYNIPISQLAILDIFESNDMITQEKINYVTVLNQDSDRYVWKLVIDSTGTIFNIREYNKVITEQYKEKYGKLAPDLYDILKTIKGDEKVKVGI